MAETTTEGRKAMKTFKKIVGPMLLLILAMIFYQHTVMATDNNINYDTYKYGTHQTSMASTYYLRPAQVKTVGSKYLVTMTIRTKKALGAWPVQVLSIDNQAPMNVQKTRHGSDYDYVYSFETSDLSRIISSKIKVDIPGVYHATHMLSFKFDSQAIPKLNSSAGTTTAKKAEKVDGKTQMSSQTNKGTKAEAKTASPNDQEVAELILQAKKQAREVKNRELDLARMKTNQNIKNRQANEQNQKMFYYVILGGSLSLVVLIVAAVFFVYGFKTTNGSKVSHEKA